MNKYAEGGFVRNTRQAEWRVGRIVSVAGSYVTVRFEGASGEKKFTLTSAPALLECVREEQVPADVKAALAQTKPARRKRAEPITACSACGKLLNHSRYSVDGRWKSCPRCSVYHGKQHVYRWTPDAFGTSAERVTADNPDGVQSHCTACRDENDPELESPDVRLCSELKTQDKQP